MSKLDTLLKELGEVPEDAIARVREGFKEYKFECGVLCANAKNAIEFLTSHIDRLQQENKKLKNGTATLLKAANEFERYLGL